MSECKYCKAESFDRPYCPACAKKYFNMNLNNSNNSNNKESITVKTEDNYLKLPSLREQDIIKAFGSIREPLIKEPKFYNNNFNKYNNPKHKYNKYEYWTNNGVGVRSVSEMIIGNFLERHNIEYEYEKEFLCDNGVIIHPDFYIKGPCKLGFRTLENVFIEHWGMLNHYNIYLKSKYEKEMKLKISEYKEKGITLICTYEKDLIKKRNALIQIGLLIKLIVFTNNKINFRRDR